MAEQRDKARALACTTNPGIIHELERQLDEQKALGAALEAAASAAAERRRSGRTPSAPADALAPARGGGGARLKAEARLAGRARGSQAAPAARHGLEQTRWREAAAGTHAAHAEEKARELREAA